MLQGGTGKELILIENGWKLIIQVDKKDKTDQTRKPIALYNLNKDPEEKQANNLIQSKNQQKRIKNMFAKYNTLRENGDVTGKK